MNTTQQVVILSAELSSNRFEQNRQRTENLAACLDDCHFKYKRAVGVYKGSEESSFVVIVDNDAELETLKSFAFKNFSQESVLYQDSNQEVYLLYNNDDVERLGRLTKVSESEAMSQDNYTIMGNSYYVTKQR